MTAILTNEHPTIVSLQAGELLTITTGPASTARYGRLGDTPGANVPDVAATYVAVAASKVTTIGPCSTLTRWSVEAVTLGAAGGVAISQSAPPRNYIEAVGDFSDVRELIGAGAPTDGTTGANVAGPGSRYTDTTGANLYINAGTKASPAWKLITRAA